jgi:hypothetical protein
MAAKKGPGGTQDSAGRHNPPEETDGQYYNAPLELGNPKKYNLNILFEHVLSGQKVRFRAFLTEFSDSWSSEWEAVTVYGRMDDIRTFKRTSRVISLGWTVVAASLPEARFNLDNCSRLISMLYPAYEGGTATSISGAPLFKLKFGNLISDPANSGWGAKVSEAGLVGTIDGLDYKPNIDGLGFFVEHGTRGPRRANLDGLFAKEVALSCTFTVLHTKPVGWRQGRFRQEKYPYGQGRHGRDDEALVNRENAARAAAEAEAEKKHAAEERAASKAGKEKERRDIERRIGASANATVLGGNK